MSKPKILIQFDTDPSPSVFDAVVAIDSPVDQLLQYGGVAAESVEPLVHGAMFTRGPKDIAHTAIFVGGSNVAAGEKLVSAIQSCFFGPMRVSVMLDSNGANTTAAAAVLAAARHIELAEQTFTVLAATGPVGRRVALLLARAGAIVRVVSRSVERAGQVVAEVTGQFPDAQVTAFPTAELSGALAESHGVFAAGAAGVQLLDATTWQSHRSSLKVAIDLNAVPPAGIEEIELADKAVERQGVLCYGPLGVGGTKMKIHKEAIRQLFTTNDQVLDAAAIFEIGQQLEKANS